VEFFDYSIRDLNRKIDSTIFLRNGELFKFRQIYNREDVDSANEVVRGSIPHNGTWVDMPYPYRVMDELEWCSPPLGYFNHRGCSYYLVRTVQRQYKLGFNLNNYSMGGGFEADRLRLLNGRFASNSLRTPGLVSSCLWPEYIPFSEVIDGIVEGTLLSGAVSKEIAINQTLSFNHPVISYKDKVVGYVDISQGESYLFEPADYIERIVPFPVTIKGDGNDLISRY
jgi:hypothetical protein